MLTLTINLFFTIYNCHTPDFFINLCYLRCLQKLWSWLYRHIFRYNMPKILFTKNLLGALGEIFNNITKSTTNFTH